MNRVSRRFKKKVKGFSSELFIFFEEYPWPGNVRQLLHEVEHMVALTPEGERISLKHCSPELQKWRNATPLTLIQNQPSLFLPQRVEEIEIACIRAALLKTRGNKLQASKLLGITRQGLDKKLKRYKM
jgi:transcriptional regulator with PAS, ATPase and Fis domain